MVGVFMCAPTRLVCNYHFLTHLSTLKCAMTRKDKHHPTLPQALFAMVPFPTQCMRRHKTRHTRPHHTTALTRFAREAQDAATLGAAQQLVRDVHPSFFQKGRGMLWKVNVDGSPITGLEDTGPNDDAVSAWLCYSLLQTAATALGVHRSGRTGGDAGGDTKKGGLAVDVRTELADLESVVALYARRPPRATADPLGFGLSWWKLQWFAGPWCSDF